MKTTEELLEEILERIERIEWAVTQLAGGKREATKPKTQKEVRAACTW